MQQRFFLIVIAIIIQLNVNCQQASLGIGVKAGLNFANITKASSINNSSRTGFHAGVFLSPPSRSVIQSRTELIFSRQGYNYSSNTNTGNVNLDYLVLPQLMGINITKYVQLQVGAQMAYLLNAKVDSTSPAGSNNGNPIMDAYNRFDYGFAAGIELHPIGGLLIGARFNTSLGKLGNGSTTQDNNSFFPGMDAKNNVVQLFAGWRFGK